MNRWIYGPVPSRRFGRSLGVDLAPFKVCSYDCLYCQVGRTTDRIVELRDFGPVAEIVTAVRKAVSEQGRPDVITLAGSGEPTLYLHLEELIRGLGQNPGLPVVVLTNGGLLWSPKVARAVAHADVLAPSLDAGNESMFRRLNRPHPDINFDRMLAGLRDVTQSFPGTVRLEVMLVRGANDSRSELEDIARALEGIRFDSIDVNTVVRPVPGGAKDLAVSMDVLEMAASLFGPKAQVVPTDADLAADEGRDISVDEAASRVLDFVQRRPATVGQMHESLGVARSRIEEAVSTLEGQGAVRLDRRAGKTFVTALVHTTGAETSDAQTP